MEVLDELIGIIADLKPDIGTVDLDLDDVDVSTSLHFIILYTHCLTCITAEIFGFWYWLSNHFMLLQNIVSRAGAAVDNDACMTLAPVDADVSFLQPVTLQKNMLSCLMVRCIGKKMLH
jgi:hypothetical protein